MRIALIGYGKMGKEVERAAKVRDHEIVGIFDTDRRLSLESLREANPDVAIDFTQPNAVLTNVRVCAKTNIPLVIGTTGWDESLEKVKRMTEEAGIGCMIGSNFSVGVNLFLEIVRKASRAVNAAGYDAYIVEAHHRSKKDFPSGTALRIADAVLAGLTTKSRVTSELRHGEPPQPDSLLVSSIRAGAITGTHTVGFESEEDSIELTHRAKSRQGFAAGAVRAAEWIRKRKGFYRFEENLFDVLEMRK